MKKLCLLLMLVLLLASCGSAQGGQGADASSGSGKKDQSSEGAEAGTASPASLVYPASLSPEAGIFSKKDLKSDYDASSAGKITWDEKAQTAGGGMTAEEARISQTLSRIAGAGETRVAVYYAQEASAFGSGGGRTPVGAVVVARGAEDIVTRLELRRAAETLLGLSPGQVEVFAMEEKP